MSTPENARDEPTADVERHVILPERHNDDVEGHFSYAPNHKLDENDARSEGTPFSPNLNDNK